MNMRKLGKIYNKKKKKNVNLLQYFRGVEWDFEDVRTARKFGAPKAVAGGGGRGLWNLGSIPFPTISAERFYEKNATENEIVVHFTISRVFFNLQQKMG